MYTEIVKIIEGGLKKDVAKVASYAKLLAENLQKEGNSKLSEKILKILKDTKSQPVLMDQLVTTPVDHETRLNIVDLVMPSGEEIDFVISRPLRDSISQFITTIEHKNELQAAGLELNTSLLLYGPPGCGKTTVAKYISKELKLPLVVARLDSLVSSLLGNTAKNLRKVFEFAGNQPCILFLDEFDAIAKARDDQHELGELKRVINSLLQNIDDFTQRGNILIAATNHPELLDKAIWRRFNSLIEINRPNKDEVLELLKLNLRRVDYDFLNDPKRTEKVLGLLENVSPSDIKAISQNAIAKNIIEGKGKLSYEDLLLQVFLFNHHGSYTQDQLISFLREQGVSQALITEICKVSIRQVRNTLK